MMQSPILEVDGLHLQAGEQRLAGPLSFSVHPGEFWCLLGPNGAGKTTLLRALASAGRGANPSVRIAGKPVMNWSMLHLARLRGMVSQQVHDAFSATVIDVVLQGRHPHMSRWQWEGREDRELALSCLSMVGLHGFAERDVLTLSAGERQRVAVATLLTQDPPLGLLDEPLSHLDLAQQLKLVDMLAEHVQARQRAVFMSVHDLSLAQRVASHVIVLSDRCATAGAADEVMQPDRLAEIFGHRLSRVEALNRTWWLPH